MNSTQNLSNDSRPTLSPDDVFELQAQTRAMKKALKNLSKNQLIQLLLEQVNQTIEQQNLNKVLLEKSKENESAE